MPQLTVIIPARNELFLRETIQSVMENATADTEVLAILDGAWAEPPIPDHPKVQLLYLPEPIGQRASVNLGAKVSESDYIMKLDGHCTVAKGFDTELIRAAEELGPDVTQIPRMYNLHAFNWRCTGCGEETYQGPTPTECGKCDVDTPVFERKMIWQPRRHRVSDFMRFDHTMHFQYWGAFKTRPEAQEEIADLMSSVGACFFMRRDRFWQLGGLDEAHGSWGQFGTEVACKSWLSGGRQVVNKRTWFAHMFRTQGGDFSFPYPLNGGDVDKARKYSRHLWMENAWEGQRRPLSWLLEKFAPLPGWHDPEGAKALQAVTEAGGRFTQAPAVHTGTRLGLCYYTDNRLDPTIAQAVQAQILRAAPAGTPIVSVSLQPIDFGQNIVLPLERSYLTMFKQILAGLEALDTDHVCLTEHDVLYSADHFAFLPPKNNAYYYNRHTWKVDATSGQALFYFCDQTLGLSANRQLLLTHYRTRVARVEAEGFTRSMGFEPGTHRLPRGVDDVPAEKWMSKQPLIDIRHTGNLTQSRWAQEQFRNQKFCQGWTMTDAVPGWGVTKGRFQAFLHSLSQ